MKYFFENDFSKCSSRDFNRSDFSFRKIDTTLNFFHRYLLSSIRGGLASPFLKLIYTENYSTGFQSGLNTMNVFNYSNDSIKYFRTRTPYTELFLEIGQGKEQFFKLIHSQNITKQWNVALNILRANSEGIYQRQNMSSNNLSVSSNFVSKSNRYVLLTNGIYRSFKKDENGGIEKDSLFENNVFSNRKLIEINLTDARSRTGERNFFMKHFFYFGKKESLKVNDSVSVNHVIPRSYISYSFSVKDHWFVYADKNPLSGFYNNVLRDTIETLDSTHVTNFENSVALQFFVKKIKERVFYTNSINNVFNKYDNDSMIMNHIVGAEIFSNNSSENFSVSGKYVVSGTNLGDYFCKGEMSQLFKKRMTISLFTLLRSPEYLFTNYTSNHFQWINTFSKISEKTAEFKISDGKGFLTLNFSRMYNYVYFDSTFLPMQNQGKIDIASISGQYHFSFKKMHFDFFAQLQISSDTNNLIHLPVTIQHHSLYYEDSWFKKVMQAQVGIDLFYYTSFYSDGYIPAVGAYYLQNNIKTGNYPYIDFFFNMKIRYTKIFFKAENVTAGLFGYKYYTTLHYPSCDRILKFGISIKFWD